MKKPPKTALDPFKIFRHAAHFHESDHRLRNSILSADDIELVAHPSMVLSALASELYLKCLLGIETGKVPVEHNLKSLFLRLNLSTRKHLERLWDEDIRRPDRQKVLDDIRRLPKGEQLQLDLPYALDIGANAFIEIRYIYERKGTYFILSNFPDMLRKVILENYLSRVSLSFPLNP